MIDHNPQYEIEARERENGFRDATANEIRQLREDENYRYRDRQRMDIPFISMDKESTVKRVDFERMVEDGIRLTNRTPAEENLDNIVGIILSFGAFFGFFLLIRYLL